MNYNHTKAISFKKLLSSVIILIAATITIQAQANKATIVSSVCSNTCKTTGTTYADGKPQDLLFWMWPPGTDGKNLKLFASYVYTHKIYPVSWMVWFKNINGTGQNEWISIKVTSPSIPKKRWHQISLQQIKDELTNDGSDFNYPNVVMRVSVRAPAGEGQPIIHALSEDFGGGPNENQEQLGRTMCSQSWGLTNEYTIDLSVY